MKSVKIFLITVFSTLIICLILAMLADKHLSLNKKTFDFSRATSNTCKIDTPISSGSGIILPSGNVLTAKHVLDHDEDGLISESERHVLVYANDYFYPSQVLWPTTASVTSMDIAIIHTPYKGIHSSLSFENEHAGAPLYSIGHPLASDKPHIYFGIQSYGERKNLQRASMPIEVGASGSAVFNANCEIVGMVVEARVNDGVISQSWSEYISMGDIKKELEKNGVLNLLTKKEQVFVQKSPMFYFSAGIFILGIIILIYCVLNGSSR